MSRPRLEAVLLAGTFALLSGCGEAEQKSGAQGPVAIDGAKIFAQQCSLCHGADGSAASSVSAAYPNARLSDAVWARGGTPHQISQTIRNGAPGTPMPPFAGRLTTEEIEAVTKYVLTLAR